MWDFYVSLHDMFVDTHTHFYDEWLLPDAEAAIQRALDAGVGKMIQADIDSHERPLMWEIGDRYRGVLFQMAGLYPGSVGEDWKQEMDMVMESVSVHEGRIVAIGEIGLDYHEGKEFSREQKEALRVQFELAAKLNLPVNIHLRDAWEDFFEVLEDCSHLGLRGNLHCFSGSLESYQRANRYGDFSVGIGGVITFKNSRLAQTVSAIPLEKILLETDAPYLAPTPHRGSRNESSYIPLIARAVAEAKGTGVDWIEEVTTQNAEKLFGI